jgi:hypothetical protein
MTGNTLTISNINHVFSISTIRYDWQLSLSPDFTNLIVNDDTTSGSRNFDAFVSGGNTYYVRVRVVSNWINKFTEWFSTSFVGIGQPQNWNAFTPQNTLTITGWNNVSPSTSPFTYAGFDVYRNVNTNELTTTTARPPEFSFAPVIWIFTQTPDNSKTAQDFADTMNSPINSSCLALTGQGGVTNPSRSIIFDLGSTFLLTSACVLASPTAAASPGGFGTINNANFLVVEYWSIATSTWIQVAQHPQISSTADMGINHTINFGSQIQARFWRVRNLFTGGGSTVVGRFQLIN